jgi:hypothetical protein
MADKDVWGQSPDPMEQLVVSSALQVANAIRDASSGVQVFESALGRVAQGITQPAGPTLARLATDTMYGQKIATLDAQVAIGLEFTSSIQQNGTNAESIVAYSMMQACDRLIDAPTTVDMTTIGFHTLAAGIQGPIGGVLGSVGAQCMNCRSAAGNIDEQCAIGLAFTKAVQTYSTDSAVTNQATDALRAYSTADADSGKAILENFLLSAH